MKILRTLHSRPLALPLIMFGSIAIAASSASSSGATSSSSSSDGHSFSTASIVQPDGTVITRRSDGTCDITKPTK
ncbi:MAG TPA: hypothetical protein VGO22_07205 [Pseudorhizobium sp.]|jgi:hypothetical protein|nr:hypothetical protein [Pseudorhizobium sp.]